MSLASQYSLDRQDGISIITCDITYDGFPDTIIVDDAAIEKDRHAFILIDAMPTKKFVEGIDKLD